MLVLLAIEMVLRLAMTWLIIATVANDINLVDKIAKDDMHKVNRTAFMHNSDAINSTSLTLVL